MENCYYIRPPIDRFATLQFGSFDDIEETGYKYGTGVVSAWVKGTQNSSWLRATFLSCLMPPNFLLISLTLFAPGGTVLNEMLSDNRPGINRVPTQAKTFVTYESDIEEEYYNKVRGMTSQCHVT